MIRFLKETSFLEFEGQQQTLQISTPSHAYSIQALAEITTTTGGTDGTPIGLLLTLTTSTGGSTVTTYASQLSIRTKERNEKIFFGNKTYKVKV